MSRHHPPAAGRHRDRRDSPSRRRGRLHPLAVACVAALTGAAVATTVSTQSTSSAWAAGVSTTGQFRSGEACVGYVANESTTWAAYLFNAVGTTVSDISGHSHGATANVAGTLNSGHPCSPYESNSTDFSSRCVVAGGTAFTTAPASYSIEIWFKTTSTSGGKLIGFTSDASTDPTKDTSFDRMLYLDPAGRLVFGNHPGALKKYISTTTAVNDGAWHHAVGTLSSTAGTVLYLDGVQVASDASVTTSTAYSNATVKVGCGNLSSWPDGTGATLSSPPYYLTATIADTAVYTSALSAAKVAEHYSGRSFSR